MMPNYKVVYFDDDPQTDDGLTLTHYFDKYDDARIFCQYVKGEVYERHNKTQWRKI